MAGWVEGGKQFNVFDSSEQFHKGKKEVWLVKQIPSDTIKCNKSLL